MCHPPSSLQSCQSTRPWHRIQMHTTCSGLDPWSLENRSLPNIDWLIYIYTLKLCWYTWYTPQNPQLIWGNQSANPGLGGSCKLLPKGLDISRTVAVSMRVSNPMHHKWKKGKRESKEIMFNLICSLNCRVSLSILPCPSKEMKPHKMRLEYVPNGIGASWVYTSFIPCADSVGRDWGNKKHILKRSQKSWFTSGKRDPFSRIENTSLLSTVQLGSHIPGLYYDHSGHESKNSSPRLAVEFQWGGRCNI